MISSEQVQKIRRETGYGVMDIKRALEEAAGDETKALELLKAKGVERMGKRADRVAREGIVEAYVHLGRIGVLVEVNCETDFVAKNEDFQEFAHEVALQISSMAPSSVEELLAQPYVKDPNLTIEHLLHDVATKTGEKVTIARFARFALGEASQ